LEKRGSRNEAEKEGFQQLYCQLYEHARRNLASRNWKYIQSYADAKTAVLEEILAPAQK
jgi:GrpB-like predicted nucleotidyltransferase (UPF0157 family)